MTGGGVGAETVMLADAESLPATGSSWSASIVAETLAVPADTAFRVMLNVVVAPEVSVPGEHVT
jgi:hypothetical protein